MSQDDQKLFLDAVAIAENATIFTRDWTQVISPLGRLAMPDMLQSINALTSLTTRLAISNTASQLLSGASLDRIKFAYDVVDNREIKDYGLPLDQVNDGREFLGCTRLDNDRVTILINQALISAKTQISNNAPDTEYAQSGTTASLCCGEVRVAWASVLVGMRRGKPGASLVADVAAAAHYMLARFHVCAWKATKSDMKTVIDGYDQAKRRAIRQGDKDLSSMALDKGNRPFPPDYAITRWAYKGADDGDADRLRCNPTASWPLFPEVDRKSY